MKRFSSLLVVLSVLSLLTVPTFARGPEHGKPGKRFHGLWEGIDPVDGSSQKILISAGVGGAFSLAWSESYWTICDGRRAILQGIGERDPDTRNTLVFDMAITCFDPEEIVLEDTISFRFVGRDLLLASAPGAFVDLPFFRVSSRGPGGRNDHDR